MSIFCDILKGITGLFSVVLCLDFLIVLVRQYYSPRRMIRSLTAHFKFDFLFLSFADLLSLFFSGTILFFIYHLVGSIYLLVRFRTVKFRFSRRSALHFFILISFVLPLFYFYPFLYGFKIAFSVFSVLAVFFFLLPFETAIKARYIRKARRKTESFPNLTIIGITGSFGKTSFRHYLHSALSIKYRVQTPKKNTNTLMGITRFINEELTDCDILILELGIDSHGQMEKFGRLFSLDYAVVTSIGKMHLATFETIDNIVKEKMKIRNLLKKGGKLFLNGDNPFLSEIDGEDIVRFSEKNLRFVHFGIEGMTFEENGKHITFPVHSAFFAGYLDGILSIADRFSIRREEIFMAFHLFTDFERRNQVFMLTHGYLIDNSYNANLRGIEESLHLLDTLKGISYVITGGIIEQGADFVSENTRLRDLLKDHNVIFVGGKKHPLIRNHSFSRLLITKSEKDAYMLIRDISPDNILLLSKGDDIYLR